MIYSKKRILCVLFALVFCILFMVKATQFFTTYFDASYKVVIACFVAFMAYWYILIFAVGGIVALVYGCFEMAILFLSIATTIATGGYTYFYDSFVVDVICGVSVAVLLAMIGMNKFKKLNKTQ